MVQYSFEPKYIKKQALNGFYIPKISIVPQPLVLMATIKIIILLIFNLKMSSLYNEILELFP